MQNTILKIAILISLLYFQQSQIKAQIVTCPASTDLGFFGCTNINQVPSQPITVSEATAPPYNIGITGVTSTTMVTFEDSDIIFYCIENARTVTRTIIVYDDANLSFDYDVGEDIATCTFTIQTVPDTEAPVFEAPLNINISCPSNWDPSSGGIVEITDNNCPVNSIGEFANFSYTIIPGKCPGEQIIVQSWVATDHCGNANDPQTQRIIIEDITGPEFTVPADVTVTCQDGIIDETITGAVTDGYDICEDVAINVNSRIVTAFTQENTPSAGATTYTKRWAAVDGCNNTTIKDQIIIVECPTEPVLGCTDPNATNYNVNAIFDDGSCWTGPLGSLAILCPANTDLGTYDCNTIYNVPQQINTVEQAMASPYNIEITGNFSNIWVVCEDSDIILVGESNAREVIREVIIYDDYNFDSQYTPGEEINTCTFTISTIADTTAPLFTAPPDTTITCANDLGPIINGFTMLVSNDNCPDFNQDFINFSDAPPATGKQLGETIIVRSWAATDAWGNSNIQTQTITIKDETGPECIPNCHIYDWTALKALYESTSGDNWTNQTGWDTQIANQNSPPADCDFSGLFGVTLDVDGRVISLDLRVNNLNGIIPTELELLSYLTVLNLRTNQLSENIPVELGNLVNLTDLNLQGNLLKGTFPPELGDLTNLVYLRLHGGNQLTGRIPPEIGDMGSLTTIVFDSNQFSGSIPPEIGNLSNLTWLTIANNQLSGKIPPELDNLSNLINLRFEGNKLSGDIPPSLGSLSSLQFLRLDDNQLSGRIPPELGSLTNLDIFDLSENKLTGEIPSEFGNLINLERLNLNKNKLIGEIPLELGDLLNLLSIGLSNNNLSGNIPINLGNVEGIAIQNNYFTCTEIENFQNISQVNNFTYTPQYYDYGEISTNIATSFDGNNTYQLSAPINSNNPGSLSYQWYQNDKLISGATNSTLNITVNEPEDAGLYSLQVTETCASGIDFFSAPVSVGADGSDFHGQPIVKKQVIVQYNDAQSKQEVEAEIFEHYNYELALVDYCNCNRELYLYEFEDAADQFDFILELSRAKGKSIVIRDTSDIDDGGFNYKLNLGTISNSEDRYKVTTNCEDVCEDTLDLVMLDTGFVGDSNDFLKEPEVDLCDNAVNADYLDSGWHGTYGFNIIIDNFATNAQLNVMPLKIFNENEQATLFDLICGLYHAIDDGSDVINISGGYYGPEPFGILEDAIIEANANGIFIVAAAGNEGYNIDDEQQYPAYFAKDYGNVISVGSIDAQENYSDFSNYSNNAVTIAAYGEDILSTVDGFDTYATGTSMSTFIASKELANEYGINKSLTLLQVWDNFVDKRLIYKSALQSKTITSKYLDVLIELVPFTELCVDSLLLPQKGIYGVHQASKIISIKGSVELGDAANFMICTD